MIEKLLALLERFVTAHERLAASQEALLQNCACNQTDLIDEIKEAVSGPVVTPAPETRVATPAEDTASVATAAGWNPFLEPVQGRYGKDKLNTLDAELAARGITLKSSATGAEKHQALLDWANAKKDELADELEPQPAAEPAAEPVTEPEPEAPGAPVEPITRDMVRALAQKAMTGAGKLDAKAVQDLFDKCAGVRRLPDIPEDKLAAVYAELAKTVGV